MFSLKNYQLAALAALREFLSIYKNALEHDGKIPQEALQLAYQEAFEANGFTGKSSYNDIFHGAPSVCLRIPTGGGKTVIAASAIKDIDEGTIESGAPVVLWLTPSDPITIQTYEALNNTDHPYRKALEKQYPSKVKVCTIDSVETLQPNDFRDYCIVIVSTNQTFNITDTSQRNVYSFNENFEAFFINLSEQDKAGLEKVSEEEVKKFTNGFLTEKDIGRVKYSLANLLKLYRPILIVDEAHNNRTHTYFNTLNRLSPSACLELTATPMESNNTIFSVSAWDLKAANMIKLPILLTANELGWEPCITEAVLMQKKLELETLDDDQYIRPIVLIQAENKGGIATVAKVEEFLYKALAIPEDQVAIYTGTQKDFQSSELFKKDCPIRYVITVKALKEGWDCSFAYVLCGLQDIQSSKDTEQLMGRVLRMPYAQRRKNEDLNRAYAYLQSSRTQAVALKLQDGLVKTLGFDRLDASDLIQEKKEDPGDRQPQLPLFQSNDPQPQQNVPVAQMVISGKPEKIKEALKTEGLEGKVSVLPVDTTRPPSVKQEIIISTQTVLTQSENENVEIVVMKNTREEDKKEARNKLLCFRYEQAKKRCEKLQKKPFKRLPLLLISEGGLTRILSADSAFTNGWNPIKYGIRLSNFPPKRIEKLFILDSNQNKKFQYEEVQPSNQTPLPSSSLYLSDEFKEVTVDYLINWIADQVQRRDLIRPTLLKFIQAVVVGDLISKKQLSLDFLNASRVPLSRAISNLLDSNYNEAKKEGFQGLLDSAFMELDNDEFYFEFVPGKYQPSRIYEVRNGSREFQKHYYPRIHDLRYKTEHGTVTEEYQCAVAIDTNPKVEYWIRNIEKSPDSFRLPIPTGNFYPDFVVQLKDGRLLVVEYKGEQLKDSEDTKNKRLVGYRWESLSRGKCLFLLAEKDKDGMSVTEQIESKICSSPQDSKR